MLTTTTDIYQAFLDGIKKEYTGTVSIPVFQRIWNVWAQPDWLNKNVSSGEGIELTQKQIDDLQVLRQVDIDSNPITPNQFVYPTDYFRLLNVKFRLTYSSNTCGYSTDYRRARIMRTDEKVYAEESVFRSPSLRNLYYEQRGGNIYMLDIVGASANSMKLEYLRYPIDIVVDQVSPVLEGWNETQKREILDLAIRTYLERVKDQRYQTVLNESNINNIAKQ